MNLHRLTNQAPEVRTLCGGGYSGPSAAEQRAQEEAARKRAQAEADRYKAAQDLERQKQADKALADQTAMANSDAARRQKNRTLLAGLASEEGSVTDPVTGEKKKRSSLLGG